MLIHYLSLCIIYQLLAQTETFQEFNNLKSEFIIFELLFDVLLKEIMFDMLKKKTVSTSNNWKIRSHVKGIEYLTVGYWYLYLTLCFSNLVKRYIPVVCQWKENVECKVTVDCLRHYKAKGFERRWGTVGELCISP